MGAQRFEYDIRCNLEGPYGLEITADHLFINPAILLIYSPKNRNKPARVQFEGLRAEWRIATPLRQESLSYIANNYEELADSPFWIGNFFGSQFVANGTDICVVIDAPANTFNMSEVIRRDRLIVNAEADYMGGLPIKSYLFLYQFSKAKDIEGMEHTDSTAIHVPLSAVKERVSATDSVTAHEFFHLWM